MSYITAERIRVARLAAGLTQVEVANRLDVQQGTVSAWETGRKIPTAANLIRLAALLNVTVDDLTAESDSIHTTVAERVRAEREAQGLSPYINDPVVLARIARVLRSAQDRADRDRAAASTATPDVAA